MESTTDGLTLSRAALDEILAHARGTHPAECCGAVVVRDGRDVVRRFTNIQDRLHREDPAAHPRGSETAYAPEPAELLAVVQEGERPGGGLKVFYHSHTRVGAYFSGEDRARAMFGDDPAYPDVTYLVVSDSRTAGEARAFRWQESARDFVEVTLEVVGA
jgi:proteasome lid subunit RPN8/RPN11